MPRKLGAKFVGLPNAIFAFANLFAKEFFNSHACWQQPSLQREPRNTTPPPICSFAYSVSQRVALLGVCGFPAKVVAEADSRRVG